VLPEEYATYVTRVRAMTDRLDQPPWLRTNPEEETSRLLDGGETAVLLLQLSSGCWIGFRHGYSLMQSYLSL
jgi:hypothetical protein